MNYRGVIHFVAAPKKAGICALQCVAVCCRVLLIVAACCSATESRYGQMQIGWHKILRLCKTTVPEFCPWVHDYYRIIKWYKSKFLENPTALRRLIGCLVFIGHFQQKSPISSVFFAENDLRLKASSGSSPLCITPGIKITSFYKAS